MGDRKRSAGTPYLDAIEAWYRAVRLARRTGALSGPAEVRVALFEEYLRAQAPCVGVLGSLEVGKSTLLNAVIGRPGLLNARAREATSTVTAVRFRRLAEPDEQALVVFAHGCTFELVDEDGEVALDDLEEAIALMARRDHHVSIERGTFTADATRDEYPAKGLDGLLARLRALEASWRKHLAGVGNRPPVPRRMRLDLSFCAREQHMIPLASGDREVLNRYMAVSDRCVHRTVARIALKIDGHAAIGWWAELLDLPGRASRNAWRNEMAALVATRAVDQQWVCKWSIEDPASCGEMEAAVAQASAGGPAQRFVVTRMGDSLHSFTWDRASELPEDADGAALFRAWIRLTWIPYLRRVVGGAPEQLIEVADRCAFVSASEDGAERLEVHGGRFVHNPFRQGLRALMLATAFDQAFRSHGAARLAKVRLVEQLASMLQEDLRATACALREAAPGKDGAHDDARGRLESYRGPSLACAAALSGELEGIGRRTGTQVRALEQASQTTLRCWGERDGQLFLNEIARSYHAAEQAHRGELAALRKRLLRDEDVRAARAMRLRGDLVVPGLDGSAVEGELSGLWEKAIDAVNVFRLLWPDSASLKERDRKRAAEIACRDLKEAVRSLCRQVRSRVDAIEAENERLLEVVASRARLLERLATEAARDATWRKAHADRIEAAIRGLEEATARVGALGPDASAGAERASALAARLSEASKSGGVEVRVRASFDLAGAEPQALALLVAEPDLGQWWFRVPRPKDRPREAKITGLQAHVITPDGAGALVLSAHGVIGPTLVLQPAEPGAAARPLSLRVPARQAILVVDLPHLAAAVVGRDVAERWRGWRLAVRDAVRERPSDAARPGAASLLDRFRRRAVAGEDVRQ
jgi:hypothetical protein